MSPRIPLGPYSLGLACCLSLPAAGHAQAAREILASAPAGPTRMKYIQRRIVTGRRGGNLLA